MRKIIFICGVLLFSCLSATAAEVEITWHEPEKYVDITPANDTKARYQERVFSHFEQFFEDFAEKLPQGYKWQITVTNIDLAGDVDHFATRTGQPVRVVKDIHSPAIAFSHVLWDENGAEVINEDEQLRDMSFMMRGGTASMRKEFEYEQKMLADWFNRKLLPEVNAYIEQSSN